MSQESNRILQRVREQCQRYFDVKHVSAGPYSYDPAELEEVPHLDSAGGVGVRARNRRLYPGVDPHHRRAAIS